MTLMNPMARWGAAWLVSCGLLTGCTDEVKFEQVSAQKQSLETNVYLNSENLILKLAPTDEEWLADPVDEANVIKNFKANLLRGQRGKQLRIQGEWAEYQLDNGVTGWSRISLWSRITFGFPVPTPLQQSCVSISAAMSPRNSRRLPSCWLIPRRSMVLTQCVLSQGLALFPARFWNWTTSLFFVFRLFELNGVEITKS